MAAAARVAAVRAAAVALGADGAADQDTVSGRASSAGPAGTYRTELDLPVRVRCKGVSWHVTDTTRSTPGGRAPRGTLKAALTSTTPTVGTPLPDTAPALHAHRTSVRVAVEAEVVPDAPLPPPPTRGSENTGSVV